MPAQRKQTRTGPTDHAPKQRQRRDRLDVLHAVGVVRDPHGPGEDRPPALEIDLGRPFDVRPINAARRFDGRPLSRLDDGSIRVEFSGVFTDVRLVDAAALEDDLRDPGQEGDVAADGRHEIEVGDAGAEEQAPHVARHLESYEPEFLERIDHDDLAATALDLHQRPHEPRMVGRRIAADQKEGVALVDILEVEGRGAAAGDARQTHARGLMAVEGAVVDVVGAPEAGDHLQQEARFVARTTREVEEGPIGLRTTERGTDAIHRVGPLDRAVPIVERTGIQRRGDPTGRLELARGERTQLLVGVLLEEPRLDPARHVRDHRLQRLLADLGEVARLVDHAAGLAAHAERAGLAGVVRPHRLPELEDAAGLPALLQRVPDGGESSACGESLHAARIPEPIGPTPSDTSLTEMRSSLRREHAAPSQSAERTSEHHDMKSTGTSYLLWLLCLIGFCGIHRLYNGRIITGVIWLLTGGLLLIGQIIDLFLVPGMVDDANRRFADDVRRVQGHARN